MKAACLIRVPTEVIKTRSQTSSYGAMANSSLATAKLVWKTDGFKGFYRGFGTTVMREVMFPISRRTDKHTYPRFEDSVYISAISDVRNFQAPPLALPVSQTVLFTSL